ncbi:MAG: hypothetical protein LLF28_02065 [Nitrospiraceae bacterium]|nr:hypothetical protein [Nitrospiraceae bacterium]
MKKLFILTAFSLYLLSAAYADIDICKNHPALKISRHFVPDEKDVNYINPYIANIESIYLLQKGTEPRMIGDYISWYLNHTNYSDKFDLTGTMYDYKIYCKGWERALESYDSADGYAGTFLFLVYEYFTKTKDKEIIFKNKQKLEDIAYVIAHLQDEDGLTRALPGKNTKYLMDNCEAYAGIRAFNKLSKEIGWGVNAYYVELEQNIKDGILSYLYKEDKEYFYWAIEGKKVFVPDNNKFYPDALSQIFPILYDLMDENKELKQIMWKKFKDKYSNKMNLFSSEQRLIFELTERKMSSK